MLERSCQSSQGADHGHDHDHEDGHDHSHSHGHDHGHDHDSEPAPSLKELEPARVEGDTSTTPLRILQMDCPTEEALIRKRLKSVPQVLDVQFNLMQRVLTVRHTTGALDTVLDALRTIGFTPELPDEQGRLEPAAVTGKPGSWWPLGLAAACALLAELAHAWSGPAWMTLGLSLIAVAISGLGTYRKGWVAILSRNLNINALMSIAVTGALLLKQWPEAAMVMVLFAIAERIEAHSLDRARQSVAELMEVAPDTVTLVQPDGRLIIQRVQAIVIGQRIRVRPGERIGLDGQVVAGHSQVNQAPITGESLPVEKSPGDTVFAGSINGMAELDYEVTAAADDTMLARIIHAVHDAQARKAPIQRFIDRFARIYTPAAVGVALLVAVIPPLLFGQSWAEWLYRALVLLVIACPCALVIATPVAVVSALGLAARNGVLVKGGRFLEQARHLKFLALDKTGTLTTGRPSLAEIVWPDGVADSHLSADNADVRHAMLAHARALAGRSDHPVSMAIANGLDRRQIASIKSVVVQGFQAVAGGGVQARIDQDTYWLGQSSWVGQQPGCPPMPAGFVQAVQGLQEQGATVSVLAGTNGQLVAFAVADTLRPDVAAAIRHLQALGLHGVMLSGDHAATVKAVARQAGLSEAHGGLFPDDKIQHIERLKAKGVTGMVGDGINDAPALACADIGFAMGVVGTDVALETADVALMEDDLEKISWFVRLSQRTHRILVENITVALGLKLVFLVLAILGVATMWMAVFADVGASLIVLANSVRLLRNRPADRPDTVLV
ncbi:MAG TPA: heavy metal translocating P-type ATPase [Burkholderiaceae bacterium]|nr:heavy metal translocating P-type ATPase [Burkholderiaceae bacterium]